MKSTIKFLGIIALAAVIVFSASCKGKSNTSSGDTSTPAAASAPADTAAPAAAAASADPASVNNWDTFIKEYEYFFLNEYIPMVNKMKAGDMTVYAQLQTLQVRFSEWAQKMQNLALTAGEPTDEQEEKLEALNDKINEALGE